MMLGKFCWKDEVFPRFWDAVRAWNRTRDPWNTLLESLLSRCLFLLRPPLKSWLATEMALPRRRIFCLHEQQQQQDEKTKLRFMKYHDFFLVYVEWRFACRRQRFACGRSPRNDVVVEGLPFWLFWRAARNYKHLIVGTTAFQRWFRVCEVLCWMFWMGNNRI